MVVGPSDSERVQQFAADLRALRAGCGDPSFREMARRAHYSSSTLAEAVQGRRLPTRAVVEAFARACGSDPDALVHRWLEVAEFLPPAAPENAGSPENASSPENAAVTGTDGDRPGSPRRPEPAGRRERPRSGVLWSLVIVGIASAGAGAVGGRMAWAGSAAGAVSSLGPNVGTTDTSQTLPTDGQDPADQGCGADAVVQARSTMAAGGRKIGTLELRYSPHCQAGWARFYLKPNIDSAMVEVRLQAQDGRAAAFTYEASRDLPVYTDLLHPNRSCLRAVVTMPVDQQLLTETTPCLSAPTAPNHTGSSSAAG